MLLLNPELTLSLFGISRSGCVTLVLARNDPVLGILFEECSNSSEGLLWEAIAAIGDI
jgi:hypothetical protein